MECIIRFTDQSNSFTHGVEYGRILEKMERGDDHACNNGFPIRLENKEVVKMTCQVYGYIPVFGRVHFDEWVEFTAIKDTASKN